MNPTRPIDLPGWSAPTVCLAVLLAGCVGFGLARVWQPVSEMLPTATAAPTSTATEPNPTSAWESRWREAAALPNSPATLRLREALLEELARTDHERALALVQAEGNWLARDALRNAALRGWGAMDPEGASAWAMALKLDGERLHGVLAVLTGAAERPDDAIRVGLKLCAAEPVFAGSFGHALINALVERTGSFDAAARFASEATNVDRQSFLLDSAFYQWAQHDIARARDEFTKITDPDVRRAALKGITAGWSDADPRQLAQFAQGLPEGDDRSHILSVALPKWVNKDPDGALQWINQMDPDPDFDRGLVELSNLPSILYSQPTVALELTENIVDSSQRTLTRQNVFYRWALHDPDAARRYAQELKDPERRQAFLDDVAMAEVARKD